VVFWQRNKKEADMKRESLSEEEKGLICVILEKSKLIAREKPLEIIDTAEFLGHFDSLEEGCLINGISNINPRKYGFHGRKFIGLFGHKDPEKRVRKIPENLEEIRNQKVVIDGKTRKIPVQFLTPPVHEAYEKMMTRMREDIGFDLQVKSGYRSPMCQFVIFLKSLKSNNFNLGKTFRMETLPYYCEHCHPINHAVDFITIDSFGPGESPVGFAGTDEYQWFIRRAKDYGFSQTYPKNNALGMMFKPWHWKYMV